MTNFNENILSKIIARRIVAPEDRANLLPFATPIYCPDANGVKASRVTIIDPNANTLFTSDDFLSVGAQFTKGVNNKLVATGTPVVNNGIYTGSTTNFYKITLAANDKLILTFNQNVTTGATLCTFAGSNVTAAKNGKLYQLRFTMDSSVSSCDIDQEYDPYSVSSDTKINPTNTIVNLIGTFNIDLTQSTLNGTPLFALNITKQPGAIKNTVDIDLDKHLDLKYFIPTEVDLKTNIDLINFLKSDAAVKFKHAVSTEIHTQLEALVTGNLLPKIEMAATLSDALGSAVAKLIKDGTGQKFSIYKYNNGAPIEYIKKNNQPNIDKVIQEPNEFDFTTINDVDVPALYYVEKPTLILDNNKFEDYQQGLCGGTIRDYIRTVLDVDTTADTMTNIGEGIFGTNDCFAVAFTQPSIKRRPSQEMFGDELYITIYYGVKLINKTNLTVFE